MRVLILAVFASLILSGCTWTQTGTSETVIDRHTVITDEWSNRV